MPMRYFPLLLFALAAQFSYSQKDPEMNVIYGDKHVFTINTPSGWVNDKKVAISIGLASYFYAQADARKEPKSYIYAMGYDKDKWNKNLRSFVNADIATFDNKYPNLTYCIAKMGRPAGIIDATMITFSNLTDRYRDEVVYMETDFSILIFVLSTFSKGDYINYQPVFEQLMSTFLYCGSDPKSFFEKLGKKN